MCKQNLFIISRIRFNNLKILLQNISIYHGKKSWSHLPILLVGVYQTFKHGMFRVGAVPANFVSYAPTFFAIHQQEPDPQAFVQQRSNKVTSPSLVTKMMIFQKLYSVLLCIIDFPYGFFNKLLVTRDNLYCNEILLTLPSSQVEDFSSALLLKNPSTYCPIQKSELLKLHYA